MKIDPTMPENTIFYDRTCPMCRWYTREFIRFRLLDEAGRVSFSDMKATGLDCRIDLERGRNEIPLVDHVSGRTLYGVDAMVHLLKRKLPWLPKFAAFAPMNWFVRRLYKFVSYNRRTIAPSVKTPVPFDCTPDFNWTYRLLYLALAFAFSAWLLPTPLLFFVLGGLAAPFWSSHLEDRMEWLGQMATILFVGTLLFLPLGGLGTLAVLLVGGFMSWDLWRRARIFRLNLDENP